MAPLNIKFEDDDDHLTVYEWRTTIPLPGQSVNSAIFFLRNNKYFECTIAMKQLLTDNFEILVKKSYFQPAKARITICAGKGTPIVKNIEDWSDVCKFDAIPKTSFISFLPTSRVEPLSGNTQKSSTLTPPQVSQDLGNLGGSNRTFASPFPSTGFNSSATQFTFGAGANFNNKLDTADKIPIGNNDITITCKIEWYGFIDDIRLLTLQKGLKDLYLKPEFSDLEIKIGDTKLPVHKIILIAQSRKFLMNISVDVKCMEVTDIDVDTMKKVLWYLYSGETEAIENPNITLNVLAAAVNYDIVELKEICTASLLKNLSIDNALEILKVAYEYRVTELHQQVFKFIIDNKRKISSLKEFKDFCFDNVDLTYELVMLLCRKK